MNASSIAMIVAGLSACAFALAMLFQRSLYSAALCLLAAIVLAAGLFVLSGAPLLGFLQIMIYAGAVMVLVVVTIMASKPSARRFAELSAPRPLALLASAGLLAELLALAWRSSAGGAPLPVMRARIEGVLFSSYALATEAVTLLLFISALAVLQTGEAE